MDDASGSSAAEIARLRGCLNDLVGVMALPAMWGGGRPAQIVGTLVDALYATLRPEFVMARVNDPEGHPPVEASRTAAWLEDAAAEHDLRAAIDASPRGASLDLRPRAHVLVHGVELRVASARLGLDGDMGVVVAGSRRPDFPLQTERLVLDVAANEAAVGLQQARRLADQERLAVELDRRVAERTGELAASNDHLRNEIAERRHAEEALRAKERELAHVSKVTMLSALTASIAHEVNQPLSGIVTNAGTCLRMLDATPPDIGGARETARRTIRDGNRAADVIARLRALFARRDVALEPLDLNDAVREVITVSANDFEHDRIVLRTQLARDLPIVTGDRIQLQQVVVNLLRNASEAMRDVSHRPRDLLVRTEPEEGDRVRLTVRDAGVGLPPQGAGPVFEAFHTTKSGGMGIGLFVSRSIVERHHGRLWAEPNGDGPGATFSFSIPRDAGKAEF